MQEKRSTNAQQVQNVAILDTSQGWLAVNKPPHLPVIPARNDPTQMCLRRLIERQLGERVWVVHRLDRDTSGVVLFARNAQTHRELCTAFETGRVAKTYLALVLGHVVETASTIQAPLHRARKGKMRPALPNEPRALPATTRYRAIRKWHTQLGSVSLMELRPLTGRQHQLRVHLRFSGVPLLVDPLYAGRKCVAAADLGLRGGQVWSRLTLHASRIEFRLGDGLLQTVEAPVASDLGRLIEALDRGEEGEEG